MSNALAIILPLSFKIYTSGSDLIIALALIAMTNLLVSSNKALDQEQQLHAITQKSLESHRLQLEESQRPKLLLARLNAVFATN